MGITVGRPIMVGEVLSKSTELLRRNPALLIPQVIVLVLSLLEVFTNALTVVYFVLAFASLIVSIIVWGAYPSMVQAALAGKPVSISHALRQAAGRFGTLLVAGILVGIIIAVGFIALIVPGIIFVTWYAYSVPAIMLENKGALAGMSASKAFGRDKKWATFKLGLAVFAVAIVVTIIQNALDLASTVLGHVVYSLLFVPVGAWIAVIITYTYLTYGPSGGPAPPVYTDLPPVPMSQTPQPGVPVSTVPSGGFCRSCGTPLQADARFCPNCGQAV